MAGGARISGLAIACISVGGLVAWSGIDNRTVGDTLRALAGGKLPAAGPGEGLNVASGGTAGTSGGGTVTGGSATGNQIAETALQYAGKVPYGWGDATPQRWDCSGMVNWVLSHDLGMAIPGYKAGQHFTGHGPDVALYVLWGGARHVSAVEPGDLIIWPPNDHIGIATSGTQFVSALDTALGTEDIPIASNGGGWIARRITATLGNFGPGAGGSPGGTGA